MRQQNSGAMGDFILPYSAVYLRIQKWKNYWNRSTFAKVIVKNKSGNILWPIVYIVPMLLRPGECMGENWPTSMANNSTSIRPRKM